MRPQRSEVINGPNLGGFLGLAPDLRRLGQLGLAWLWNAGTGLGIWHFPKSGSGCDPAGNGSADSHAYVLFTKQRLFLSTAWTSQSPAEKFFLLGFSERVCVCSCALLSLLGFWHHASSIQLKPSLTG